MRSSSSAAPWRRILFLGLWAVACSNEGDGAEEDGGEVEIVVPPVLRFSGLTTTEGVRFESTATSVALGCDRRFTVHLDPALIRGENGSTAWVLQPPDRCGSTTLPCGYVRLVLQGEDGVVATREAAALDFVVEPGVAPADVVRLEAELIQGSTRLPLLVGGRSITAAWELDLSFEADCEGVGGAGGGANPASGDDA